MPRSDKACGARTGVGCDIAAPVVHVDLVTAFGQSVGRGDADDACTDDGDPHSAASARPSPTTGEPVDVRTAGIVTALDSVNSLPLVSGASR